MDDNPPLIFCTRKIERGFKRREKKKREEKGLGEEQNKLIPDSTRYQTCTEVGLNPLRQVDNCFNLQLYVVNYFHDY